MTNDQSIGTALTAGGESVVRSQVSLRGFCCNIWYEGWCQKCEIHGPQRRSYQDALERWNRRAPLTVADEHAEVVRLRKDLERIKESSKT